MAEGPIAAAIRKLAASDYLSAFVYAYLTSPAHSIDEDCLRVLVEKQFPDERARDAVLETASASLEELGAELHS